MKAVFLCFGRLKKIIIFFSKYFSNRIEKLHKMAYILKKFENVEKTVFLGLNFSYTVLYPLYSENSYNDREDSFLEKNKRACPFIREG